jgi:hypothetical protein
VKKIHAEDVADAPETKQLQQSHWQSQPERTESPRIDESAVADVAQAVQDSVMMQHDSDVQHQSGQL